MELEDRIGRTEEVNKICSIVDGLQKDKHMCVALDGEWGSGKTFVMQMIEEKLKTHEEYIIVKYDAWKNNFYSDPLIAILYCVMDSLKDHIYKTDEKRKRKKELALTITKKLLKQLEHQGGKYTFFAKSIKGIYKIIEETKSTMKNNKLFNEYKSYQNLLFECISQLNQITAYEEYQYKQTKLIILVDEIDRCLPNEQMLIMERIHHLFDVKNCAVICAINKNNIQASFSNIYGGKGEEYLRKFFDLTFYLNMLVETYIKNLCDNLIKNLKTINNEIQWDFPVSIWFDTIMHSPSNIIKNVDNREIDRYFEILLKAIKDFSMEKLQGHYLFFIMLGLFIKRNISNSFLSEKIIKKHKDEIVKNYSTKSIDIFYGMYYYDYINEFFKIDRANIEDNTFRSSIINYVPSFLYNFNEIVHFSLNEETGYINNQNRINMGQKIINREDCVKLREIILNYGGENRC